MQGNERHPRPGREAKTWGSNLSSRCGSQVREQTPNGRDRALSSENRLCPFPLLRMPTIHFAAHIQRCNPTNALGVQYKPSHPPSLVPPSNRPSPITPTRRWPTTPPTNENAMAHTAPVQEKLDVDNSSTHETLVEGSEDIMHHSRDFDTLHHIPNTLRSSCSS